MILIDGSNLLHRQVHVPSIFEQETMDGLHPGIIQGFLNSIDTLYREYDYAHGVVVAWDKGSSDYRRKIFSGYKQGRRAKVFPEGSDEHNKIQAYLWARKLLHTSLLPLTNTISTQIEDIEADDIIAFLSRQKIDEVNIIVSTDKDFLQLVSDAVQVWNPTKRILIDKNELIGEYKLYPKRYQEHFLKMRALEGDKSDDIPGVSGIGAKRAHILIGSILTHRPELINRKHKYVQSFISEQEIFKRNIKLMNLQVDLPEEYLSKIKSDLKRLCQSDAPKNALEILDSKLATLEIPQSYQTAENLFIENGGSKIKEKLLKVLVDKVD